MKFHGKLQVMIDKARQGNAHDVEYILNHLNVNASFDTTRFVDYALSCVSRKEGIETIRNFLFNGNQMQRNYAALFFLRMGENRVVKRAHELGLIDDIQAFSR